MKSLRHKNQDDFYKLFKPQLTPKKMLELGVFGGSYFGLNIKKYPKSWFKNTKISKSFDASINCFKVKSGLSRKNGKKKVGFLKKILLDGFNGIADFQKEDVFLT